MTCQANDGMKKCWIYAGEHAIKHKGPGCGLHYHGIICSTFGWLADAGQMIEYGKNYDGYWNSAMFVQQVCPHFSESFIVTSIHYSSKKKLFRHLREHMVPDIGLSSSLTIHRDTQHTQLMPYRPHK